jgi:hypothetical protein
MTILLIVILCILLVTGGAGYRADYWGYGSPGLNSLLITVLVVILVVTLLGAGPWRWR